MRMLSIISLSILAAVAGVSAQTVNDTCGTALFIGAGTSMTGTNIGATSGPDPVPICGSMGADVWYFFVAGCTGTHTASTCSPSTTFDTVIAVWDGTNNCGASLIPVGCNDDGCNGPGANYLSSVLSFQATAGTVYFVSVGGYLGSTGNFMLSVSPGGAGVNLAFSNLGPNTMGFAVTGAPALGTVITIVTLNPGAYPNGWFFGIDVQPFELTLCLTTGFPLTAALDTCGSFAFGPVGGVPGGITVSGVAFAIPLGATIPSAHTLPAQIVIP